MRTILGKLATSLAFCGLSLCAQTITVPATADINGASVPLTLQVDVSGLGLKLTTSPTGTSPVTTSPVTTKPVTTTPVTTSPVTTTPSDPVSTTPANTAAVYPSGLPLGIFGSSYALNQPIDTLPVDTRLIATQMGGDLQVAASGAIDSQVRSSVYGSASYSLAITANMPVTVVSSALHPEELVNVLYAPQCPTCDAPYIDESDSIDPNYTGPKGEKRTRLIPVKSAVIEGNSGKGDDSDGHMIVPDVATMRDYELFGTTRAADGSLTATQVTVWDMKTGKRISDSGCDTKPCTSADAAGLPILAALPRGEEVQYAIDHNLPDIGHAMRVTYKWSRQGAGGSAGWYAYPGTHASGNGFLRPVVMGMRLRIPASMTKPAGLSAYDTVIWNTLAKYGEVVADNGATGYLPADTNPLWNGFHNLSTAMGIMAGSMEVVNTGCWQNAGGTHDNTGVLGSPCQ